MSKSAAIAAGIMNGCLTGFMVGMVDTCIHGNTPIDVASAEIANTIAPTLSTSISAYLGKGFVSKKKNMPSPMSLDDYLKKNPKESAAANTATALVYANIVHRVVYYGLRLAVYGLSR
ncbi:MAG: hypothetical protein V1725_01355 [archaeon]